jgi:peptidoglycan/LPS O-acetylase OafA/YrhL
MALLVVISHARVLFFEDFTTATRSMGVYLFYLATSLGHQAVIVFFTLSGYWELLSLGSSRGANT